MKFVVLVLLLGVVSTLAQTTRSVVISTNNPLTVSRIPYATGDARVVDSPISRLDASTVSVTNVANSGNLIKGIAALTGTNTTTDWSLSDKFSYALTASSTNTHSNVPTTASEGKLLVIRVSSDGVRTIDFVFPGGITTNWVSEFNRTPRNGQTIYLFEQFGSTVDISAIPDVYATADNQILGRAGGTLQFSAPSTFGIAAGSSLYDNTLVTVSNTVTETAIYTNSTAIAANALGTNKQAILRINGDILNNTGGTSNFTFKAYVGTAEVANGAIAFTAGANRSHVVIELSVANINSASSQRTYFRIQRGAASGVPGSLATAGIVNGPVMGTAAEDSTSALPLSVTITPQHAVGTMVMDKRTALLQFP